MRPFLRRIAFWTLSGLLVCFATGCTSSESQSTVTVDPVDRDPVSDAGSDVEKAGPDLETFDTDDDQNSRPDSSESEQAIEDAESDSASQDGSELSDAAPEDSESSNWEGRRVSDWVEWQASDEWTQYPSAFTGHLFISFVGLTMSDDNKPIVAVQVQEKHGSSILVKKWTGTEWVKLGDKIDVPVVGYEKYASALEAASGEVYVLVSDFIVHRWNGSTWKKLPSLSRTPDRTDIEAGPEKVYFAVAFNKTDSYGETEKGFLKIFTWSDGDWSTFTSEPAVEFEPDSSHEYDFDFASIDLAVDKDGRLVAGWLQAPPEWEDSTSVEKFSAHVTSWAEEEGWDRLGDAIFEWEPYTGPPPDETMDLEGIEVEAVSPENTVAALTLETADYDERVAMYEWEDSGWSPMGVHEAYDADYEHNISVPGSLRGHAASGHGEMFFSTTSAKDHIFRPASPEGFKSLPRPVYPSDSAEMSDEIGIGDLPLEIGADRRLYVGTLVGSDLRATDLFVFSYPLED